MGEVLYELLRAELPRRRGARLCAGRRPSRPARLSGAAAAGERRQFVVRGGRGRSRRCRSRRSCGARRAGSAMRSTRAIRTSRCRATSMRPERRNSAGVEFGDRQVSMRCSPRSAAPRCPRQPRRWSTGRAARHRTRGALRRSTARSIGSVREGDDAIALAAMVAARRPGSPPGRRRRSRRARQCSSAPAICSKRGAAG